MAEAIDRGAVPLHRGDLADGHFLPGQDLSAYAQPVTLLNPPSTSPLHHAEPERLPGDFPDYHLMPT